METELPPREFSEALVALKATLEPNKPALPSLVVQSYWGALREFPVREVIAALNRLLRTAKWFPKPAEIREQLQGGTPEELAEKAVGELDRAMRSVQGYRAVCFSDRVMTATIRNLGGWAHICNWTDEEWPFRTRDFKAVYANFVRVGVPEDTPAFLPGYVEKDNPRLWGDEAACQRLLDAAPQDRSGEVIARLRQMNREADPYGMVGEPGPIEDTLGKL